MKKILKLIIRPKIFFLQILVLILTLLYNSTAILIPILTSKLIDNYLQTKTLNTDILLTIILIAVTGLIIGFIEYTLSGYVSELIGFILKTIIFRRLTKQSVAFIQRETPAKLLTILTNDVSSLKDFLATGLILILSSLLILFGSVFAMFSINSTLTFGIFILLPPLVILITLTFFKSKSLFTSARKAIDHINKAIDENIYASMLIRVFTSEQKEKNKFEAKNKEAREIGIKIVKLFSTLLPLLSLFSGLATVIIIYIGGLEVIKDEMTIGEITAFNTYISLFVTPLFMIGFFATSFGQSFASAKRISIVLNENIPKWKGNKNIDKIENIEFKNLSYIIKQSHDPDPENNFRIKDINLTINRGERIGILGATGSGKSLLFSFLLGFFTPDKGEILINDISINSLKIKSIRNKIGFVSQDNIIFNGTVRENITLSNNIKSHDVWFNSITSACLVNEFIENLPNKFEEIIGEHGSTLSGGQKQRITIARALYKKPEVLILDDSTSKLDITTENNLLINISKLFPDITLIIISQKIVTLESCDRIYIFENGKIIDTGTPDFLSQTSTPYKEFELSQSNFDTY